MNAMTRTLMVGIGLVAGATLGAGPALAALNCGPCDHGNGGWNAGVDCANTPGAVDCLRDNGAPILGNGDCNHGGEYNGGPYGGGYGGGY
ncbi:hypothetical protein SAMN06264365_109301 [Actinoplanes regularis]|uniref:Uncharacterized protein n=2 Tax=Actinoplanes regularis TaxID=52697 RepID=A0A239BJX8_9ACTN|nr:hypothetical protein [Actinoplanes regularis]GIE88092.1 hypothetical protein Are01nite_45720 [Actinoplanes regularis]SNS08527.1 hypothetical protein SAMN06264365_109301 [Actinoplanes regularis]